MAVARSPLYSRRLTCAWLTVSKPTKTNGPCNIRHSPEMELPALRSCSVRELNAASVMQILYCFLAPFFSFSFSFSSSFSFFLSFQRPRLTEPKRKGSHHYLQISYLSISMSQRCPVLLCTCTRLHRQRRRQRRFHSTLLLLLLLLHHHFFFFLKPIASINLITVAFIRGLLEFMHRC